MTDTDNDNDDHIYYYVKDSTKKQYLLIYLIRSTISKKNYDMYTLK